MDIVGHLEAKNTVPTGSNRAKREGVFHLNPSGRHMTPNESTGWVNRELFADTLAASTLQGPHMSNVYICCRVLPRVAKKLLNAPLKEK